MTGHDHELVKKLYAYPDKDPPVNIASRRIDDLVRRLLTREISFAELHQTVEAELQSVFEASQKHPDDGQEAEL